jgi:hypothetical protein
MDINGDERMFDKRTLSDIKTQYNMNDRDILAMCRIFNSDMLYYSDEKKMLLKKFGKTLYSDMVISFIYTDHNERNSFIQSYVV